MACRNPSKGCPTFSNKDRKTQNAAQKSRSASRKFCKHCKTTPPARRSDHSKDKKNRECPQHSLLCSKIQNISQVTKCASLPQNDRTKEKPDIWFQKTQKTPRNVYIRKMQFFSSSPPSPKHPLPILASREISLYSLRKSLTNTLKHIFS